MNGLANREMCSAKPRHVYGQYLRVLFFQMYEHGRMNAKINTTISTLYFFNDDFNRMCKRRYIKVLLILSKHHVYQHFHFNSTSQTIYILCSSYFLHFNYNIKIH